MFAPFVLLVSLAAGPPAPAGTGTFQHGTDLRWHAVEGCPEPDELVRSGGLDDASVAERGMLIASLRRRADHRYELELVLFDGTQAQVRRATARDCETLVETVVLVARTWATPTFGAIEPRLELEAPPVTIQRPTTGSAIARSRVTVRSEVPVTPSPPAAPLATKPAGDSRVRIGQPDAPPPIRRRARSVAFGIRADALLGGGVIAPFEGGLTGTFSLWIRGFRAEIGGGHLFRRDRIYAPAAPARVRVSASFAILRLCGQPRWRTLAFPICTGVDLGVMQGRGENVSEARTARRVWPAWVGGAAVGWSVIRHLAVVVGAEMVVALARPVFSLRNAEERAFAAGRLGGRARIGLEVQF